MGISNTTYSRGYFEGSSCFVQYDRPDCCPEAVDLGSEAGNPWAEVNDFGGFGNATTHMLMHICGYLDHQHAQGNIRPSDFMELTFDGHHFMETSIPSHIAFFFASNPRYGISPMKGSVINAEWVREHPDILQHDLFSRGFEQFARTANGRDFISCAELQCQGSAFVEWVATQHERFSMVFTHDTGLDCFYRALGIDGKVPRWLHEPLKSMIDARVGYHAFYGQSRDPSLPVWLQKWDPKPGHSIGEALWAALGEIETDYDHIITFDGGPVYDRDALTVRHGIALIHQQDTFMPNRLAQYTDKC